MIAQEHRPLAFLRNRRRQVHDVGDGETVLHLDAHEQARHHRKMECHVALVPITEVRDRVLGPLVRFREDHALRILRIDMRPHLFQELVRLWQVLAVGALALE